MVSKKHYSPRYQKHRDLARISASATGSPRVYRFWKSMKHGVSRAHNRANLAAVVKSRCICIDDSVTFCPRCDGVAAPIIINRRTVAVPFGNVKALRWTADNLNPAFRWASAVRARHGERVLEARLRGLPGPSGVHLKAHIHDFAPVADQPVCGAAKLERAFLLFGLKFTTNSELLLREVARHAYLNNAEPKLALWTHTFTSFTMLQYGYLRQNEDCTRRMPHRGDNLTAVETPLRKKASIAYKLNSKWRRWRDEPMLDSDFYYDGVYRPLYSCEDINEWAHDMTSFFNVFYGADYFHTAYGRWVLRATLTFLTQKEK